QLFAAADIIRIEDDRKAPAAFERPLAELRTRVPGKEALELRLPDFDGFLWRVGDQDRIPIDRCDLTRLSLLGHHRDHGAHHRRVVDHRPGHVAVLAGPDLAHAGFAAHQHVALAPTDAAGPLVHDGFTVVGERRALEG